MRILASIAAIALCTLTTFASAECGKVKFGGVSTPENDVSYILYREPSMNAVIPLRYRSNNYMDDLKSIIGPLCWDIYSCTGITKKRTTMAGFIAMCTARTEQALDTATSEAEALKLTEDALNYWTELSRSSIPPDDWYAQHRNPGSNP